jgi:predicted phage terminase large subunit-like protein
MSLEEMLAKLPLHEQEGLLAQVSEYKSALEREKAQSSFMAYVKMMWPGFVHGRHHAVMAKKFEAIANGTLKRLIINMAPRHTKSEFASYLLPSWFLGKYPGKKIIQSSNTSDLAVNFGRKVRNLVGSEQYSTVFPNVSLRQDSKSAGRWATNQNGEYFAIGVGGTVTGKGADLLIIDDPHSEQEAAMASGNADVFDKTYEWYTSGPRQRLQPGGAIVIVMCMTGDTLVRMSDGNKKQLSTIRKGDLVATFEKGKLTTAKVNNWRSSGVDSIYRIQTQSGRILRANERHPFLVMNEGVLEWTRLHQLRVGDELVSLKDATGHHELKPSRVNVAHAWLQTVITEKIQMLRAGVWDFMAGGKMQHAQKMVVQNQSLALDSALGITIKNTFRKRLLITPVSIGLSQGTESRLNSLTLWLQSAATSVMSAVSPLRRKILEPIGMGSYVLTTAMTPEKSVDCSVTIATSQSDTERRQIFLNELRRISDFTTDQIVKITPDGKEEVFDVEIDRTENFIANGVVSHNTRWGDRDLTGRIIKDSVMRGKGEEWEVVEFPAIMPSGSPLWPEFWSLEELEALKEELPPVKWNAQYQQSPTGEEGALVKRDWWQVWQKENPPACEFVIQSWDTAFTKSERSDFSACTTWGVFHLNDDPNDVNVILLDAFQKRMEFPELKEKAYAHYMDWEPDAFVVEAKAAGTPLIFELRRMGLVVSEYTPSRGNDKFVRLNSVTDLFRSGKVWAPETRWAQEVIEQMASFPNGSHDDLVDSSTQALIRFRQGGFIRLNTDEKEDTITFPRKASYY